MKDGVDLVARKSHVSCIRPRFFWPRSPQMGRMRASNISMMSVATAPMECMAARRRFLPIISSEARTRTWMVASVCSSRLFIRNGPIKPVPPVSSIWRGTGIFGTGAGAGGSKSSLGVFAHHLHLECVLLFAEGGEEGAQVLERLFGCAVELTGQTEQFRDADTLHQSNVDLAREQFGALVLEQLLQLVHEADEIERIEAGFHQVVGFVPGQVVTSLQLREGRVHIRRNLRGFGLSLA